MGFTYGGKTFTVGFVEQAPNDESEVSASVLPHSVRFDKNRQGNVHVNDRFVQDIKPLQVIIKGEDSTETMTLTEYLDVLYSQSGGIEINRLSLSAVQSMSDDEVAAAKTYFQGLPFVDERPEIFTQDGKYRKALSIVYAKEPSEAFVATVSLGVAEDINNYFKPSDEPVLIAALVTTADISTIRVRFGAEVNLDNSGEDFIAQNYIIWDQLKYNYYTIIEPEEGEKSNEA